MLMNLTKITTKRYYFSFYLLYKKTRIRILVTLKHVYKHTRMRILIT